MFSVGLLDGWDKKNQETLDFHNYRDSERRSGNPEFNKAQASWVVLAVVVFGGRIGSRVLERYIGEWAFVPLLVVAIVCLYFGVRSERRIRQAWRLSREAERRPPPSTPG